MSAKISLESYSLGTGRMLRVVAMRYMRVPVAVTAILFAALLVMGFTLDWRWGFLALTLVFIVFPMMLMWLYVRHSLTRDIAMNLMEHTVEIMPCNVTVRWRPSLFSGERDASEEAVDENDHRVPVTVEDRTDNIPMERVVGLQCGINALTVWLRDAGEGAGFLYIPYSTIPEGKADAVVEIFQNALNRNQQTKQNTDR